MSSQDPANGKMSVCVVMVIIIGFFLCVEAIYINFGSLHGVSQIASYKNDILPTTTDLDTAESENIVFLQNDSTNYITWLESYNKTKLQQDLQSTFNAYSTRPDRLQISRESVLSVNDSTVLFYPQFKDPKIGPLISLYWQARMFSFFSAFYKFKLSKRLNGSGVGRMKYNIFVNAQHYWSYLPKECNIHAIDIDHDTYSKYQDWILYWITATKPTKLFGLFIYGQPHMDLMFSKIFLDVMRYETNSAFNSYYKNNKTNKLQMQNLIENEMWINKSDDVLIHIRCQDVLLHGASTYGMNSLHYFNYAIRNVFNITLHSDMAIHVVFFLGGIAGRRPGPENGCNEYLYQFVQPAFVKSFFPAQIKLIVDGGIDDDFYRFIKAPNMICGHSSYCLMGAIANSNNVVLSKEWTPDIWYKFKDYEPFGTIADNIHFLGDPYFFPSRAKTGPDTFSAKNASHVGYATMVIDGKFVL